MKTLFIVSMILVPVLAAAAGGEPRPGRYEVVSKEGDDPVKTTYHCLTAAEVAKGFAVPAQPGCKITQSPMSGGKFGMTMACPDMNSSLVGTYTATTYEMDGKIHAKVANQTMDIKSHASAKRIGDTCQKDDE